MTSVEILYRSSAPPTPRTALALAAVRDVYGIHHLAFHPDGRTLRVEYDATRLNAAAVTRLIRQTGLDIEQEPEPALPPAAAEPAHA